jgi:hypothetical protein
LPVGDADEFAGIRLRIPLRFREHLVAEFAIGLDAQG